MPRSERPSARSTADGSWLADAQAALVEGASSGSSARKILGVDARQADIGGCQGTRFRGTIQPDVSYRLAQALIQALAQVAQPRGVPQAPAGQGRTPRRSPRTRASAACPAAVRAPEHRPRTAAQADAAAHVQRADALGAVQLMRRRFT